jgi:hypothetical protein
MNCQVRSKKIVPGQEKGVQVKYSLSERGESTGSKIMFSLSSVILFWHY